MRFVLLTLLLFIFSAFAAAQIKPRPTPVKVPFGVPIKPGTTAKPIGGKTAVDPGKVAGRTYTNEQFHFEVTFPDTWFIPRDNLNSQADQTEKKDGVLLTAYLSIPGESETAMVCISVEDLTSNPQIKDAVDYFDAMRTTFAAVKGNADFIYSDTQVEKLGQKQFGFLDTSSTADKNRMYAIVRDRFAILFTISYTNDEDLQELRNVLKKGKFTH